MLVYFSPSISLSSHRQNIIIYCLFLYLLTILGGLSLGPFSRDLRELSGNMPHLVSGFEIPRCTEQKSVTP